MSANGTNRDDLSTAPDPGVVKRRPYSNQAEASFGESDPIGLKCFTAEFLCRLAISDQAAGQSPSWPRAASATPSFSCIPIVSSWPFPPLSCPLVPARHSGPMAAPRIVASTTAPPVAFCCSVSRRPALVAAQAPLGTPPRPFHASPRRYCPATAVTTTAPPVEFRSLSACPPLLARPKLRSFLPCPPIVTTFRTSIDRNRQSRPSDQVLP